MENSSELSPNVNSLDIAMKKTRAENLTENSRYSPHAAFWSGHFVLISHFFSPLHVRVSRSSLLIDFFSHFLFLSSFVLLCHFSILFQESLNRIIAQPLLCASSCVTLCHQICFVLLRVHVCEVRQLLLHYVCPRLDAHAFAD